MDVDFGVGVTPCPGVLVLPVAGGGEGDIWFWLEVTGVSERLVRGDTLTMGEWRV